ncbi:MAG TPA: hypothetical protein VK477_08915, partial [Acidobacteriota bacterium]|nr:hypothetical protein [Acidobacteriota bacterium]
MQTRAYTVPSRRDFSMHTKMRLRIRAPDACCTTFLGHTQPPQQGFAMAIIILFTVLSLVALGASFVLTLP